MTSQPQPPGFGASPDAEPTCYRHPGRVTYVRCQRCNRPICPECQIPAAVGVQCPECVHEGNRNLPRPRTTFGGAVTSGGSVVTMALIGICVVVYALQRLAPDLGVTARFSMIAGPTFRGFTGVGVADGEFYRVLTAAFLHGGLTHLLVNMFSLYMLGPTLERMFGRSRFLALYLVSAIGGEAASYLFLPEYTYGVGASGAIFGLFGAIAVVSRKLNYDLRPLLGILLVNGAIAFIVPMIDWRAHLGGLVTGALVAAAFVYAPKERRNAVQVGGTIAVVVLVAVVILLRTAALR